MIRMIFVALLVLTPIGVGSQDVGGTFSHQRLIGAENNTTLTYLDLYVSANDYSGIWASLYGQLPKKDQSGYVSVIFGPYMTLARFLEVGVGVGVERFADTRGGQMNNYGRYAYTARLGSLDEDYLFIETYRENGSTGDKWQQTELLFNVSFHPPVWAGIMSQTEIGTGPKIRIQIRKSPVKIWAMKPLWEKQTSGFVIGGDISFQNFEK